MKEIDDLCKAVECYIDKLFEISGNEDPKNILCNLFKLIEIRSIDLIMKKIQYHQGRCSHVTGYGRSTMRKKLKDYFGNKYIGDNK